MWKSQHTNHPNKYEWVKGTTGKILKIAWKVIYKRVEICFAEMPSHTHHFSIICLDQKQKMSLKLLIRFVIFFPLKTLSSLCRPSNLNYSNIGCGVYKIGIGNKQRASVYCRMSSISDCHGGGWTLVMKIDGTSVRLWEFLWLIYS